MNELAKALAAFQAELPAIGKDNTATVRSDKGNYSYKYADLATISAVALRLAGKHGLSFTARPTLDEQNRFVLAYSLMHSSGDRIDGTYPLPSSAKQQEIGSVITYARRYSLCSVLGIAPDEDDDGQAARDLNVRPEPHEYSFDPIQQDQVAQDYEAEMQTATSEELDEIGKRIAADHRRKALAPNTFRRLSQAGARRRAELAGAEPVPPALLPPDDKEPVQQTAPTEPPAPSPKALTRLHALLGELGINRVDKLKLLSDVAQRPIASSNDLTGPELALVFAELDKRKAAS